MKKLFTLLCILALSFSSLSATDYTIADGSALSNVLPLIPGASYTSSATQQIYLASELSAEGAEAGDITALKLYYGGKGGNTAVSSVTRKIEIWLMATNEEKYNVAYEGTEWLFTFLNNGAALYPKAGTKVFEGNITTESITAGDVKTLSIDFNKGNFPWNGTSNIVLTVFDVTGSGFSDTNLRFVATTGISNPRFVHQYWLSGSDGSAADYRDNLTNRKGYLYTSSNYPNSEVGQNNYHKCVNKVTFSISTATAPDVPTGLSATPGITTASLTWNEASGATSYKLYHSTSADGVYSELASPTTNSYEWSGLTANTTYYVKVAAVNGAGSSALSDPISFTTLALHIHDGITFEPWSNPSAMPTSGDYYLTSDVAYGFYEGGYLDLNGDLNLCLNGHIINLGTKSINVTAEHTMTIYDPVGGGKITGFVPGHAGSLDYKGVISVEYNGTLVFREGEVENTYPDDDPDNKSIAIAVGGTLILSGAPVISSNEMDIYLPPTIPAKVITIESGKPLTNTTPYKVFKSSGVITSGWTNMSGADPADYFESANSDSPIVRLIDGEAKLVSVITLSENSDNTKKITDNVSEKSDIRLTRSLTSAQYNTFCLPFALTNAELQSAFGAEYDLQEFVSSDLVEGTLELTFNKVTALVAGKPYLLKPSVDVVNPIFPNVTITATSPVNQTSDTNISFYGIYSPTVLEGGNKNILFLGAENELFWPETTENLKGFRAYFEVKGSAAKVAKRARIINKEEAPTSLEKVQSDNVQGTKYIENGQLFILYNGAKYNVQGHVIK